MLVMVGNGEIPHPPKSNPPSLNCPSPTQRCNWAYASPRHARARVDVKLTDSKRVSMLVGRQWMRWLVRIERGRMAFEDVA